ncbi:MAG: hypothetical protein AAF772_12220 [Acidobacteriota bacterium]
MSCLRSRAAARRPYRLIPILLCGLLLAGLAAGLHADDAPSDARWHDRQQAVPHAQDVPGVTVEPISISVPAGLVLPGGAAIAPRAPIVPSRTPRGATTILYEDFEEGFPNINWDVFDNNGTIDGEVFWDDTTVRADAGQFSAWCAGGGQDALPDGTMYDNAMNAWMRSGPYDLSAASDANVSIRFWLDVENNEDFLLLLASTNGVNFDGFQVTGSPRAWMDLNLDLTDVPNAGDLTGEPAVWIAVLFVSDIGTVAEGAYVDEIRFERTNAGPYDLSLQLIDVTTTGPYSPGDMITIRNTTQNISSFASDPYRISFYASVNSTITTGDPLIGFIDRPSLGAGQIADFFSEGDLPATLGDGNFFVGAIVTPTNDANAANNVNLDNNPITITGATNVLHVDSFESGDFSGWSAVVDGF